MPNSASSRTSTGGITGSKPCAAQQLQRPAHQRELEEDEVALQVGEARAGDLARRPPCRSWRPRARGGRGRTRRPTPHSRSDVSSSAAVGIGRVRQRRLERGQLGLEPRDLGLELLDARADRLHLGDRRRGVRAGALGLADRLRPGVALAPAPLRAPAAARSGASRSSKRGVEPLVGAVAAARQRGPRRLRVAGDRPQVEHPTSPAGQSGRPSPCPGLLDVRAGVLARRTSPSASASAPMTMFCGIGPDEKPPLRIAYSDAVLRSPCAGRSSARPCTRGSARWSASPGCRPR